MRLGRIVMGVLYVVAGAGHFIVTRAYVHIMPDYLPAHRELVLLSGAAEIAGGLGVMFAPTRRTAAWGKIWKKEKNRKKILCYKKKLRN